MLEKIPVTGLDRVFMQWGDVSSESVSRRNINGGLHIYRTVNANKDNVAVFQLRKDGLIRTDGEFTLNERFALTIFYDNQHSSLSGNTDTTTWSLYWDYAGCAIDSDCLRGNFKSGESTNYSKRHYRIYNKDGRGTTAETVYFDTDYIIKRDGSGYATRTTIPLYSCDKEDGRICAITTPPGDSLLVFQFKNYDCYHGGYFCESADDVCVNSDCIIRCNDNYPGGYCGAENCPNPVTGTECKCRSNNNQKYTCMNVRECNNEEPFGYCENPLDTCLYHPEHGYICKIDCEDCPPDTVCWLDSTYTNHICTEQPCTHYEYGYCDKKHDACIATGVGKTFICYPPCGDEFGYCGNQAEDCICNDLFKDCTCIIRCEETNDGNGICTKDHTCITDNEIDYYCKKNCEKTGDGDGYCANDLTCLLHGGAYNCYDECEPNFGSCPNDTKCDTANGDYYYCSLACADGNDTSGFCDNDHYCKPARNGGYECQKSCESFNNGNGVCEDDDDQCLIKYGRWACRGECTTNKFGYCPEDEEQCLTGDDGGYFCAPPCGDVIGYCQENETCLSDGEEYSCFDNCGKYYPDGYCSDDERCTNYNGTNVCKGECNGTLQGEFGYCPDENEECLYSLNIYDCYGPCEGSKYGHCEGDEMCEQIELDKFVCIPHCEDTDDGSGYCPTGSYCKGNDNDGYNCVGYEDQTEDNSYKIIIIVIIIVLIILLVILGVWISRSNNKVVPETPLPKSSSTKKDSDTLELSDT